MATAHEIQTSDVIILIVYLVLLLVGAYYLTKYVSKRAMQKGVKKAGGRFSGEKARWKQGQYVSVVDRIPIDRDKTILVVEFDHKHYLMATTGQDIKILDKIEVQKEKAEMEAEAVEGQNVSEGFSVQKEAVYEEDNFFTKFLKSFKEVSRNYFKKNKTNTAPFGIHLQKEMNSENVRNENKSGGDQEG